MSEVHPTASLGRSSLIESDFLTRVAVRLIQFYQRRISPIKCFRCAHRVLHGGDSCSEAILKLVQAHGAWNSLPDIRRRFRECALAARVHQLNPSLAVTDESPSEERPRSTSNELPAAAHLACGSGVECCGIVGLEGCCSLLT